MRYFNLKQHTEPKSMFEGTGLVEIQTLEKVGKELTKEQSKLKPNWGSSNISVNGKGKWNWEATNWDTSG